MSARVSGPPAGATGRHQRSLKNYLIDAHFQLKYTSFLVSIALVLSVALGTLLWRASREVIAESQETVRQGQETVQRGQEVVKESQKVSAVVHMNIVKDPVYGSNPELAAVFSEGAREQDKRLEDQQKHLEGEAAALRQRSATLSRQQEDLFVALVVALTLLVAAIGVAGIMITHRIAGPIFKMKRLLGNVGGGSLVLREKLRKGDELQHFFESFEQMVENLRRHQTQEIERLDGIIRELEPLASADHLVELRAFRAEMQAALER